jgi:3-deoxy-D-manno-octulosonic acid (KDO) 8-phosphate synthase
VQRRGCDPIDQPRYVMFRPVRYISLREGLRGQGTSAGGEHDYVPVLARAVVTVGIADLFIETHQDPDKAPSDGPNMIRPKDMEPLLERLMRFDALAKAETDSTSQRRR